MHPPSVCARSTAPRGRRRLLLAGLAVWLLIVVNAFGNRQNPLALGLSLAVGLLVTVWLRRSAQTLERQQEELGRMVQDHAAALAAVNEGLGEEIVQRQRAEALWQESEQNSREFFNSIEDFVFLLDEQGGILSINHAAAVRLGSS